MSDVVLLTEKEGKMHDAIRKDNAFDEFQKELRIIDCVLEISPESIDIGNFYSGRNYEEYHWKYHQGRILHIHWKGSRLVIRQTLAANNVTKGVDLPVIWGTEKNPILFNGQGEAELPEQASHEFWCALTGIQNWAHIAPRN